MFVLSRSFCASASSSFFTGERRMTVGASGWCGSAGAVPPPPATEDFAAIMWCAGRRVELNEVFIPVERSGLCFARASVIVATKPRFTLGQVRLDRRGRGELVRGVLVRVPAVRLAQAVARGAREVRHGGGAGERASGRETDRTVLSLAGTVELGDHTASIASGLDMRR